LELIRTIGNFDSVYDFFLIERVCLSHFSYRVNPGRETFRSLTSTKHNLKHNFPEHAAQRNLKIFFIFAGFPLVADASWTWINSSGIGRVASSNRPLDVQRRRQRHRLLEMRSASDATTSPRRRQRAPRSPPEGAHFALVFQHLRISFE